MEHLCNHIINRYSSWKERIIVLFILIILAGNKTNAQKELNVLTDNWLQYTDAQNSLYHHIAEQAYDLLDRRKAEISQIKTLADWQMRQKRINETLLDIVGPFPEKTPLNARIVRTVVKDSYRIEHIVFESQPGFFVTSSMFIPAGLKKKNKAPVIIYCSGHSQEGYRSSIYLHIIINLVKKGFIVFAFDPVGQGERLEYYDPATGKSTVGDPTSEHSYPGTQAFITGSSEARYMIWDGIRAVDYLLSRKEVDPSRIGITGRSGGGTQSAYIAAMDDRIYAAAPECYITNFTRLIQTIGPQDAEQNLFNEIQKGIDHPDFLLARAPKPTMMITTTRDYFSIQGARETAKEVSSIFKAYGQEGNFNMVEDDSPHGSTLKNREAMYSFFQKHLNNPGNSIDEQTQPLDSEEVRVTNTGQVSTSLGGETVFSLNRREAKELCDNLEISRNDPEKHINDAVKAARKLSGYLEPSLVNDPVFTGRIQKDGYVIEKYFIKGEGDYPVPYLLLKPEIPASEAVIYLNPSGKNTEASEGGEMEWLVKNGAIVLAPDMVGTGELGPGVFTGDAYIDGTSQNIWYASILIGRSIVGIQAGDVVRLVRILQKDSEIKEIYGLARKEMAPVLLHAAAFDHSIARIALLEPYSSYSSIVLNRFYKSSFTPGAVPGVLKFYDIPDIAASLAPRRLLMMDVTDGKGQLSDIESVNNDLLIVRNAYKIKKVPDQLRIISRKPDETAEVFLTEWLK